jgi:hypothetical protein
MSAKSPESGLESPKIDIDLKLQKLQQDYDLDHNPLHVWEALRICTHGVLPPWVQAYLAHTADQFRFMREKIASGETMGRFAEQVSKALGFNNACGHQFKDFVMLQRNRCIYRKLEELVSSGIKLDAARFKVAQDMKLSYPTIERVHKLVAKLLAGTRDE